MPSAILPLFCLHTSTIMANMLVAGGTGNPVKESYMFSAHNETPDNERYPGIKWATAEQVIASI